MELLAHQGGFPPISGGSAFYHIFLPLPRRFFCVFSGLRFGPGPVPQAPRPKSDRLEAKQLRMCLLSTRVCYVILRQKSKSNGTRLEKQRVQMVALISSFSAVFISLPSLYVTIAPGVALINLAVQNRMPFQSGRFAL
jgi:hypothetical protein